MNSTRPSLWLTDRKRAKIAEWPIIRSSMDAKQSSLYWLFLQELFSQSTCATSWNRAIIRIYEKIIKQRMTKQQQQIQSRQQEETKPWTANTTPNYKHRTRKLYEKILCQTNRTQSSTGFTCFLNMRSKQNLPWDSGHSKLVTKFPQIKCITKQVDTSSEFACPVLFFRFVVQPIFKFYSFQGVSPQDLPEENLHWPTLCRNKL